MKTFRISHTTRFHFQDTVSECTGEIRLTPRPFDFQSIQFSQLVFRPLVFKQNRQADCFDNIVDHFEIKKLLQTLSVTAINTVSTSPRPDTNVKQGCTVLQTRQTTQHNNDLTFYLQATNLVNIDSLFTQVASTFFLEQKPLVNAVYALMQMIFEQLTYRPGATTTSTTARDAMNLKAGVCQDYTHITLACLRAAGIAARYVSGYVASNERSSGGQLNQQAHAWVSVFIPPIGWVDIDPTHNCLVDDNYITIAWGRDYNDVAPLTGKTNLQNNPHKMQVSVNIERLS